MWHSLGCNTGNALALTMSLLQIGVDPYRLNILARVLSGPRENAPLWGQRLPDIGQKNGHIVALPAVGS